jgi:hypothetical protein
MIKVIIPSWHPEKAKKAIEFLEKGACLPDTWYDVVYDAEKKLGVLEAMALGASRTEADLLMFMHDDVEVYEHGWDLLVTKFFEGNPKMGLAGFGGAKGLGHPDIYKKRYELNQLARYNFYSNMKDAEVHGFRTRTVQQVSTLDGFCLILSRDAYKKMGGWQAAIDDKMPQFHMYDAWVACRMKELGLETWLVPIECHHMGGGTSIGEEYKEFVVSKGWKDGQELFDFSHRVIYDRFRSVLPLRVV